MYGYMKVRMIVTSNEMTENIFS